MDIVFAHFLVFQRGRAWIRDQAQNLHLAKQTEKITAKEIALRMMSLTQWTQALTQMLHGVADVEKCSSVYDLLYFKD
ncbi:hypothetical protein E2562_024048 [Oryza meyeriana var. granulata]|uniref:Uncharacterized protein n=1 Tax=Oryza meyeriana var. granulata TaxID=110450 RepID=A0A6G1CSK2_9ORYZ|nr:hypothetical protein E2562_024048 [Oryza meyeriana var. granulata]